MWRVTLYIELKVREQKKKEKKKRKKDYIFHKFQTCYTVSDKTYIDALYIIRVRELSMVLVHCSQENYSQFVEVHIGV